MKYAKKVIVFRDNLGNIVKEIIPNIILPVIPSVNARVSFKNYDKKSIDYYNVLDVNIHYEMDDEYIHDHSSFNQINIAVIDMEYLYSIRAEED